jgi:hypothetical protein
MEILTSLFTILVVILAGTASRLAGIFEEQHARTLSSFVYYFGLPALFFGKIAGLDIYALEGQVVAAILFPTLFVLGLLLVIRLIGLVNRDQFVMLGASVSFGSYAFFGVAFFETFRNGRWLEISILAASLLGVIGIVTTILLLEYATQQAQGLGYLTKIFTNPLILGVAFGLVFSLLRIQVPFLEHALNLIGQTASGLAIFVLGMFIYDHFSWANIRSAAGYSAFRILALPLAALLAVRLFLPGIQGLSQFLLLEHGMPAAIALEVFAERYQYKVGETAGVVTMTSLLNFPVLTALFYLSRLL